MIPKAAIAGVATSRGIPAAIDTVNIRHIGGGLSSLQFKSYERGREKWQGAALEVVYFDEEPDEGIYSEGLTRTNETGGIVYLCFTPLLGVSAVVQRFLSSSSAVHPDRAVICATIDDAPHFSEADKARIVASYAPHEREARTKGVPVLGSGRIFPVKEETLAIEHREFPRHWPRIGGMDFGWDHPFAAVELVWDRDTRSMSAGLTVCARRRPSFTLLRSSRGGICRGPGRVTVAGRPWKAPALRWPSSTRRKGSTCSTPTQQFEDGSVSVEAGIQDVLIRMESGCFKVFKHLTDWFDEYRLYHRKDGRVHKEGDDLMSATRYAVMMLRYARTDIPRRPRSTRWDRISWMSA